MFKELSNQEMQAVKGGDGESGVVETDYIGCGTVSPSGSVSVEQE